VLVLSLTSAVLEIVWETVEDKGRSVEEKKTSLSTRHEGFINYVSAFTPYFFFFGSLEMIGAPDI
jgi:hypothetical protein